MKKKVLFDNSVIECKRFPNIIYNVKKRLVWVFQRRKERNKHNDTRLKEGGLLELKKTTE